MRGYDKEIHKIVFDMFINNKQTQIDDLMRRISDLESQSCTERRTGQKLSDYQYQQLTECFCNTQQKIKI